MDGTSKMIKIKNYLFRKKFKFKNFIESQNFINKVSNIAERRRTSSRYYHLGGVMLKLKIFTHAIKGLAESDFILAAKIDENLVSD